MELDQYLGLFIDESKENLQKLNESLLKLENTPDDLEILNDIFRVAHTLKGMSKTMGFNAIGDLTHNMENLLDPLRNGAVKADNITINTLFECLDKLEELVGNIINGNYDDKNSSIKELTKSLLELINNKAEVVKEIEKIEEIKFNEYETTLIKNAEDKNYITKEITIFIVDDCILPGARAFMVHRVAEELGEILKTHPDVEALENGKFKLFFKLFLITQTSDKEIIDAIKKISEIKEVKINNINYIEKKTSESESLTLLESDSNEDKIDKTKDINEKNEDTNTEATSKTGVKIIPQTIRVNAERMNELMDLVGELVISRTRISLISSGLKINDLNNATELLGHITSNIQEIVMKLRMVSIDQVFNRFPRLVRDVSKSLGKDVTLKISGKDTEIDKIVIDEIGDPLVHLIRNSLDHGLESPEHRIEAGKSAKGTLELSAFNEGDNILIKVCDDGKGIDPEKIKDSAIKKGLLSVEEARKMSDKDAIELIFKPGLSTVKVATDISGRGVGMDVVKSKVTALGGNVSITSRKGIGTITTISLPSSMAIVQALLVRVGKEIYAAPLNYINEIVNVFPSQIKNIHNKEVIILREKTLTLLRLNKLLEVSDYTEDPNAPLTVVIAQSQGYYFGFVVSELLGQQEVVIKPINKKLCSEDYISGATTLGNGQVALIINVGSFLGSKFNESQD